MSSPTGTPPLPPKTESNRRLLGILFFFELILGAAWTLILITPAGHESVYEPIAFFFLIYPLQLLCMIGGGISLWKHRPNLNFAILVLIAPLIFSVAPFLINVLAGGAPALREPKVIQIITLGLFVGAVIITLVFPRRISFYLPKFLLKSFWLNLLFLLIPLLIYLTAAAAVYQWANLFSKAKDDSAGYLVAYGVLFAYIFAAITLVPATLIFLYSYLSLFQKHETRRKGMRVTQLILSVPAVAVGIWLLIRILEEFSAQA
ncbi:MAG: hypothetical protein P1U87_00705 [Verrucomicrobiales bacterium]|nr:hypothetical protein [Verrucomicrobiales bacterium]